MPAREECCLRGAFVGETWAKTKGCDAPQPVVALISYFDLVGNQVTPLLWSETRA